MLFDQGPELGCVLRRDLPRDDAVGVQLVPGCDVGDASRHARTGVPADRPQRHRYAACHVLADVGPGSFYNRGRAAVTHSKTLADPSRAEKPPPHRSLSDLVAHDHPPPRHYPPKTPTL